MEKERFHYALEPYSVGPTRLGLLALDSKYGSQIPFTQDDSAG
jgi:hypothetical protein